MSKYGLKAGGEQVYTIDRPEDALDLIEKVLRQFFGPFWTQHKPLCPLCNEELEDFEKHMNRPVGICSGEQCNSTIHASDYFGKIEDILKEWRITEERLKAEKEKQEKIRKSQPDHPRKVGVGNTKVNGPKEPVGGSGNTPDVESIHGVPVYIW